MPKPTATMPVPKPVPVKSAGKLAIKGGSVIKDPFMVRQFKLVGTEKSGVQIINQATEVAAGKVASTLTQETLQSEEDTGDENNNDKGSKEDEDEDEDDEDGDDDNNATIDVDSGSLDVKISKMLHPKKTQPKASTKVMVTDDIAPVP
ncbi:hypothetical protein C0995_007498, partial [Termitomyces sp. Mi166